MLAAVGMNDLGQVDGPPHKAPSKRSTTEFPLLGLLLAAQI